MPESYLQTGCRLCPCRRKRCRTDDTKGKSFLYRICPAKYRIMFGAYCSGLTVWETILSGKGSGFKGKPSSKDLTEVEKILKDLALERYAFTDVCSLSGGERQRVLIGRALAQDPKIILLDEPTSNLDLRYQLEVMEILRSISSEKKMTVAVVIHDLNMALQLADYMIILNKNKIVAKGIPDQILTKQLIQDVYKVDASIIEVSRRKVVIPEKLCCNC